MTGPKKYKRHCHDILTHSNENTIWSISLKRHKIYKIVSVDILSQFYKNVMTMSFVFFWSSHITITFLKQWYKNVTCHNFVMEM